ncbi:trypsin CFT-1-like [Pieris rapae]|uniref:trypsin CFT-1-like n=1 Tax=Pieris rapae TaxID=64459 RepID=UPI001E27EC73|nr:trypsin CFT-1-like [Pieris rapae]
MRILSVFLTLCVVSSLASSCSIRLPSGKSNRKPRIVGGTETTIDKHPSAAILLDYNQNLNHHWHKCSAVIVNVRSVVTAAACVREFIPVTTWRVRVGSSFLSSGGVIHTASRLFLHPDYNMCTRDNDIAIIRLATAIEYNENVQRASIAGKNYIVYENQAVVAVGWGIYDQVTYPGRGSEQLREVVVRTTNWKKCGEVYKWKTGLNVSQSMICTNTDVGRRQCGGDTGGPIYHNGVFVGVHVWDDVERDCSNPDVPAINMKVSNYVDWISQNV